MEFCKYVRKLYNKYQKRKYFLYSKYGYKYTWPKLCQKAETAPIQKLVAKDMEGYLEIPSPMELFSTSVWCLMQHG